MADSASATAWRWGDYVLLPGRRQLLHGRAAVELEDRVFDLLVLLLQSRERGLGREEIIRAIWGKRPVNDATLRQLVYKARRAVGDDGARQKVIHTTYGRSVQWIAPVEMVCDPGPGATLPVLAAPQPPTTEHVEDGTPGPVFDPRATAAPVSDARIDTARHGPLGLRRIHYIAGGMALLLVVGAVATIAGMDWQSRPAAVPHRPHASQAAPEPAQSGPVTIAVLPFLAMNPERNTRYLSDGLTEELINRLGRFPDLRVAALTSSFAFRDKPVDIREAARMLGVANVLEGSVQRSGDRIRVRVALVSAKDGYA